MKKSKVCIAWASAHTTINEDPKRGIFMRIGQTACELNGENITLYCDVTDSVDPDRYLNGNIDNSEYVYKLLGDDQDTTVFKVYSDQVIIDGGFIRKQLKKLKKQLPDRYDQIVELLFQGLEFKKNKNWKKVSKLKRK